MRNSASTIYQWLSKRNPKGLLFFISLQSYLEKVTNSVIISNYKVTNSEQFSMKISTLTEIKQLWLFYNVFKSGE